MVVCEDGRMKRSEYRKFKIRSADSRQRTADSPQPLAAGWLPQSERLPEAGSPEPGASGRFLDDFAAMNQVVMRRYRSVLDRGDVVPDLILIDGGKGQLGAAYAALEELGLSNLVAVGLAKKEESIYTRGRDEPLALPRSSTALRLLQMIRDEAHRFAVTFHRQSRRARDLRSDLDSVPGIGPRRRRALLTSFGSLAGVRRASREELTAVVGAKAADAVLRHFGNNLC
jgi:excinuclease ABC subunit C